MSSLGGQVAFPGLSLYHASKWAIEGFYEGFGPEVAPFGISTMLVEPGMARSEFGGTSAAVAGHDSRYDGGVLRAGSIPRQAMPGDPRMMAEAMIDAAQQDTMPTRLALGSDAYQLLHAAYSERLAALEAQKDVAHSTDADDLAQSA